MLVPDTNVVLSLVLRDANANVVDALRAKDDEWIAPRLLFSETVHVLAKYVRLDLLAESEAERALHLVIGLTRAVSVDSPTALSTAIRTGLSGYDAEFVALARAQGVRLATYDKRILDACSDVAARPEELTAA
jgi:predicted nucleic acid-binding protein